MRFTPPTYSKREAGNVLSAELLPFKLKHGKTKTTFAQKSGLRYEKRVFVHLMLELHKAVSIQPAFKFSNGYKYDQYAIPDALYVHNNLLTLFEVKLSHTADAWYQLRRLYQPILAAIYPNAHINVCEICRSYDPSIKINDNIEIVEDIKAFVSSPNSNFGVYIWSGL